MTTTKKKSPSAIRRDKKYVLVFFCLVVFVSYFLFLLIQRAIPLPILAQKIGLKITEQSVGSRKAFDTVMLPILANISNWQEPNGYLDNGTRSDNYPFKPSDKIDPLTWRGTGASTVDKDFFIHDNVNHYIQVNNQTDLVEVLQEAKAGDTIVISPGVYTLKYARNLLSGQGKVDSPIKLMANQLGEVTLYLSGEGFLVNKPYWNFQNLHFVGVCEQHSNCDHAFHVVGHAHHTRFVNNIFQDFNAAIKINGVNEQYPDKGTIINNTFYNTSERQTSKPVTPIDLMHANHWQVSENFIFDFIKAGGNKVSYGAFFKGGSTGGAFINNLIMCQANLKSSLPSIGLSFGGGGSKVHHRRDKNVVEHTGGVIRNNIIMHCTNDVGIYVNNATNVLIQHNTLYQTLGIDVRFGATARINNNVISGRLLVRDESHIFQKNNAIISPSFFTAKDHLDALFVEPQRGDFSWKSTPLLPSVNHSPPDFSDNDFCNRHPKKDYIGAYQGDEFCLEKVNIWTLP